MEGIEKARRAQEPFGSWHDDACVRLFAVWCERLLSVCNLVLQLRYQLGMGRAGLAFSAQLGA